MAVMLISFVSRLVRLGRSAFGLPMAMLLVAGILAVHAALLPEAHWQGDEYITAAFARDGHLHYLWEARIGGWSPRPLSELLFYGYDRLAAARQAPFIVPFLALLWSMLLAMSLVTSRRAGLPAVRILIGLATTCMFLLGHPIAEMFYWPAGAVAYLTTLAATTLVLFLLIDGRTTSLAGIWVLSAALTACAASSESGAIAAVLLALALAAVPAHRSRVLWLLPAPLLSAGFVFWMLLHHRVGSDEAVRHQGLIRHLMQSLTPIPHDLLHDIVALWPARLLFALGVRWCWMQVAPPASRVAHPPSGHPGKGPAALPAFAVALMLAAAMLITAGYFQFGAPCCERHDSLRQCWVILSLTAMAVWSTRWPASPAFARLGPAALCAACLLGVAPRIDMIAADFRLMPRIIADNRANWRAGRNPSQDDMLFRLAPTAGIAGSGNIPAGHYREPSPESWSAHGIMRFFGKHGIIILVPG